MSEWHRTQLANERTYRAYVRTALALQVAGLGVLQFLTQGHGSIRYVLGITLVAAGSALGLAGYRRFRSNERAMRAGRDMGSTNALVVVAVAVVALPLLAAVGLVLVAVL